MVFNNSAYKKSVGTVLLLIPRLQAFALPIKKRISNAEAHADMFHITSFAVSGDWSIWVYTSRKHLLLPCLLFLISKLRSLES